MTEDEQKFWDAAFCAALSGAWANEALLIVCENHRKISGEGPAEYLVRQMTEMADAALAARRARKKRE